MGIGNVMALAISMMTEGDFWDKFQKKHNPQFYEKLKKKENPEEENKSCQVNQTTSRIQSIGLNGPMHYQILVGLMTGSLLK